MDVSLPDRPLRRVMWGAVEGIVLAWAVYLAAWLLDYIDNPFSWRAVLPFLVAGAGVCAVGQYLARGILGACAGLIAGALLGSAVAGDMARPTLARHHINQQATLSGITLAGTQYHISAHRGRVVLVDFWATWCPPCRSELPRLKSLYERYHEEGLDIIGVSLDKTRDELSAFVQKKQIPWPQIFPDDPGEQGWENPLLQRYTVSSIPYTLVVDRNGKIVASGLVGEKLEDAIDKVMAGEKPSVSVASGPTEALTRYFAVFGWLGGMLVERRLRQLMTQGEWPRRAQIA
jgi:thiol-disulfide isomerase/thioredoxin